MKAKRIYHGWILVEAGSRDMRDTVSVEFVDAKDKRHKQEMERHGNEGCVDAVAFWDKKLGQPTKLESTLRGCYRVYTEELTQ